ncbi:MAG TPA: ThiF family adenylyltransferase [Candidatus Paceibacterota bacterium]|nr:ThiF family adenylyltransferase [Candidatus Paceibacterota bacterium]
MQSTNRPLIFDLSDPRDAQGFSRLKQGRDVRIVIDHYLAQQRELFSINNPTLVFSPDFQASFEKYIANILDIDSHGRWIYFPWNGALMHLLEDHDFQRVRTARNEPLLTRDEQKNLYTTTVAVAGLSVGNSIVTTLVLQGGSRRIKIADHDSFDLSNLNRIRAGVDMLGVSKIELTARQIYAINPYAEIELYPEGLTEQNLSLFLKGADVVVDEMDSLEWKLRLRMAAREHKLPLLSAADLDHTSIVDIERHDIETVPFFLNKLGDVSLESMRGLDKRAVGRMIALLVGLENHTPRMLASLQSIGKTIVSWPQLGPTAMAGGVYITYCVERIANNKPLPTSRKILSLEEQFDPEYGSAAERADRASAVSAFKKMFNL